MNMNKHIPCKRCDGRGFINWTFSEGNTGTATSYVCPDCNGSGVSVVLMTNADRIRNMTDKELANVVECPYGNPYFDEHLPCKDSCHDCILMWLQQPSEEN